MELNLEYEKQLLFRRNKGRRVIDSYLSKIDTLFCVDSSQIEFISLKDSDSIMNNSTKIKETSITYTHQDLKKILLEIIETKGSYFVFIDHDWKYCGCFHLDSLNIINVNFKFGTLITDSIVFIEKSLNKRIWLDYYEMNGEYYIDFDIYFDSRTR